MLTNETYYSDRAAYKSTLASWEELEGFTCTRTENDERVYAASVESMDESRTTYTVTVNDDGETTSRERS